MKLNQSIYLAWVFILSISTVLGEEDLEVVSLPKRTIEIDVDSSSAWSMQSLFGESTSHAIYHYSLSEGGPCTVYNPYLTTQKLNPIQHTSVVHDFVVVGTNLYFIDDTNIIVTDVGGYVEDGRVVNKVLFDISVHDFAYMDGFMLPSGDVLFFLKGSGPEIFYTVLDTSGKMLSIKKIEDAFPNFTSDMRMAVFKDLILIPTGYQEVKIYRLDSSSKTLVLAKTLTNGKEIKAVAMKEVIDTDTIYLIIADYKEGLIVSEINIDTFEIGESKTFSQFVKVKTLALIERTEKTYLVIIIDALGGTSKYIVLTMKLESPISLLYYQAKLFDSKIAFGDANLNFGSVIMGNSIVIMSTMNRGEGMIGYISNPDVNYAKLMALENLKGNVLIHNSKKEIEVTRLKTSNGLLYCKSLSSEGKYEFSIIGKLPSWKAKEKLYYSLDVSLTVIDKEKLRKIKLVMIAVGIVVGILIAGIALAFFIVCRRYMVNSNKIKEYEKFNLKGNKQPENVIAIEVDLPK